MRRASRSAVSKDFTLTLISVFRDCLLHFKATLTETYLKFSHALGKTVVTESKALSFCPYSKTISSFHSEIVIHDLQFPILWLAMVCSFFLLLIYIRKSHYSSIFVQISQVEGVAKLLEFEHELVKITLISTN